MTSSMVETAPNNVHVTERTVLGVILKREHVIVYRDGKVMTAMKVLLHTSLSAKTPRP